MEMSRHHAYIYNKGVKESGATDSGDAFTGSLTASKTRVCVWTAQRAPAASVCKALTGFLPATGGTPAVPVLHPVNLPALLCLAARPPAEQRQSWPNTISTLDRVCAAVLTYRGRPAAAATAPQHWRSECDPERRGWEIGKTWGASLLL